MPKKPQRESLPGNDGRWFLELVGVVEPEPESTGTYATLESLTPPATPEDTATLSTGAGATAVTGSLVPDGTPNGEYVPLSADGTVAEATPTPRRRVGWWSLGLALVLIATTIGAAAYLLPRGVETEAAVAAAEHRSAIIALRNELPTTQTALADLTDPSANADALSGVPLAVAELNAVSGRAISVATTPLPRTLPFVPRAALQALEPTRTTMTILGASGRDVAGRLGVGFIYRTTIDSLFGLRPLPTRLDEAAITELSIALAADLAGTGRLVADLPQDAAFTTVRDTAASASQRYAIWQLEYLDALHEEDTGRATALVSELNDTVNTLDAELDAALAVMRQDLDALIVQLARELEAAIESS